MENKTCCFNSCLRFVPSDNNQELVLCGGEVAEVVTLMSTAVEVDSVCLKCGHFQNLMPLQMIRNEDIFALDDLLFSDLDPVKH